MIATRPFAEGVPGPKGVIPAPTEIVLMQKAVVQRLWQTAPTRKDQIQELPKPTPMRKAAIRKLLVIVRTRKAVIL